MSELDDREAEEFASRAERELHRNLEAVRAEPPVSAPNLEQGVSRTLRWQAVLVVPLTAGLSFAGGVLAALRSAARQRSGR